MAPSKENGSGLHSAKKRKRDKAEDLASRKRRPEPEEPTANGVHSHANGIDDVEPTEAVAADSMDMDSSAIVPARSKSGRKFKTEQPNSSSHHPATWKILPPMGGRMSDIDPIFSQDEAHLIITYNTSLQVFSTADSLLVRRVALPLVTAGEAYGSPKSHIVATVASQVSPEIVWVACSDGRIWKVDWTTGTGTETHFHCPSGNIVDMTTVATSSGKHQQDIVVVAEADKNSRTSSQLVAYDLQDFAAPASKVLHRHNAAIQLLRSVHGGHTLIGSAKDAMLVAVLEGKPARQLSDLAYKFYSFDVNDEVCCLDISSPARKGRKKQEGFGNLAGPVNVAVGCVHGSILVYQDLVSKVQGSAKKGSIKPVKYHWHSRAVHSVRWSDDGNYLISGGAEAVLVLWQMDTGKRNYLPHLAGCIENIVVSPLGSSYAVHLDDNSTMVLSTAEMKPTAYVSGIQSLVFSGKPSKESLVRRVWNGAERITNPLVAAMGPNNSSRLLLCVGNGQQATVNDAAPSLPLLQTFDLASFQSVSKQALARNNATSRSMTSKGYPIVDPHVTHLAFSSDGKWLATVDEWQPPERDVEVVSEQPQETKEAGLEKREIYLKFWDVGSEEASLSLSSRINDPHFTTHTESILGLAADRISSRFATVGGDGMVRYWAPKVRQSDGLVSAAKDGQPLSSWTCTKAITLGESAGQQDEMVPLDTASKTKRSGALAFSEDGSILFAAFGDQEEAAVYMIDAESGEVRDTLQGLFRGDVRDIQVLGSHLVLLSDDLTVYDIVADELCYGMELVREASISSQMTQLAVDHKSRTFAVAVPRHPVDQAHFTRGSSSEVAIFTPDDSKPLLLQRLPQLVTGLVPLGGSPGYIAVDAAAQVWSVVEATEASPTAQPLAVLHLDGPAMAEEQAQPDGKVIVLNGVDDEEGSDNGEDEEMQDADADDYDTHAAVFAPQKLASIFDVAPAFAMPPIEELFYQVTALFSNKSVPASS